ncbi:protein phosphatase 2C domain-containing protein [Pseudomonas soli]|uniref:Protein phosphatase 2C domain-containing protein n=1 Tax=Pseudomonas soli TaxID=1306993 RepID=A0ABU7GSZ2_9PSED|nr:protein phosphatase 2C domain-containing protein [Pseudomonas soli]MEE1882163.1 protein phosphatase 2C domain-containing protein [Pseudomonas soli]
MNLDIDSLSREMTGEMGAALFLELSKASWNQLRCTEIQEFGIAFGSHQGLIRSRHEDRLAVAQISAANGQSYLVAVVCDGVGGSKNGDLAASIAVVTLLAELSRVKTALSGEQILCHVVRRMDEKIRSCLSGSGLTTVSVVLATSAGEFLGCSIGDSRIYTWEPLHEKKLTQISEDDTFGNEAKRLNLQDVSALAQKGLLASLSQALGEAGRDAGELNINVHKCEEFSRSVILCSDGCWKHDNLGFELVVTNAKSALESSRRALALANWAGGSDNSSVIILEDKQKLIDWCVRNPARNVGSPHVTIWFADQKLMFIVNYIFSGGYADSGLDTIDRKSVKRKSRAKQKVGLLPPKQLDFVENIESDKRLPLSERPKIEISVDPSMGDEGNHKIK